MVILQRSEFGRLRILYVLAIILAVGALAAALTQYGQSSQGGQIAYALLAVAGLAAIVISLVQFYNFPKRSHALIIYREEDMILATNAVHEGFKLRFLRDVLSENIFTLNDEERARWKKLESDGYYATLHIRNVRKVLMLKLCTMVFDDVYVVDSNNRWEHYDSANTADPTFNKREMPQLRAWNG